MNFNVLGYILIALIAIICIRVYQSSDAFQLKCVVSDIDGNKYCVRERTKLVLAADLLAQCTVNMKKLVDHMEKTYPDQDNVRRLVTNFDPQQVCETLPTSEYTAYSENKGEKLAFCLNTTKEGGKLIDSNTLMFIANHVLNSCEIIPVPRPTATMYKKALSLAPGAKVIPENVTNIKLLQNPMPEQGNVHNATSATNTTAIASPKAHHLELFNNMCAYISNVDQIRFAQLRELLYDILIYDFDITDFAWHLITELKRKELLHDDNMSDVLINTYKFLQYYNNNYRPIYHLENFVFMLINTMCAEIKV